MPLTSMRESTMSFSVIGELSCTNSSSSSPSSSSSSPSSLGGSGPLGPVDAKVPNGDNGTRDREDWRWDVCLTGSVQLWLWRFSIDSPLLDKAWMASNIDRDNRFCPPSDCSTIAPEGSRWQEALRAAELASRVSQRDCNWTMAASFPLRVSSCWETNFIRRLISEFLWSRVLSPVEFSWLKREFSVAWSWFKAIWSSNCDRTAFKSFWRTWMVDSPLEQDCWSSLATVMRCWIWAQACM